jgi:hypothetical protein
MNTTIHKSFYNLLLILCTLMMPPSLSLANPTQVITIRDISAPHPKHCLDERQWKDIGKYSPFNIFDNNNKSVWIPCSYSLKDAGYTLNIDFASSIQIDGIEIKQIDANDALETENSRLKRSKSKSTSEPRQMIEKMQIIFFNHDISKKYPIYFQEIKFEGRTSVKVKYDGMLNWNPILLGDSMFDERRRALKLSSKGMTPPIKVDKIGLVFPNFDPALPPPAIRELSLFSLGKKIKTESLENSRRDYSEVMAKVYDLMVRDFMFIGDDRAMIFAQTGTIWSMEGEAEVAKVIGGWRFLNGRIEVDLSAKQQGRVVSKRKARIESSRNRYYTPLKLIVDEAPDQILIQNGPLSGAYQSVKVPSPIDPSPNTRQEVAPSFEVP